MLHPFALSVGDVAVHVLLCFALFILWAKALSVGGR